MKGIQFGKKEVKLRAKAKQNGQNNSPLIDTENGLVVTMAEGLR